MEGTIPDQKQECKLEWPYSRLPYTYSEALFIFSLLQVCVNSSLQPRHNGDSVAIVAHVYYNIYRCYSMGRAAQAKPDYYNNIYIYIYTRKCYSIGANEGQFYIGGFVLIERQPNRLNEYQQYKTAYVELAYARPNAVAFSSFQLFPNVPFDPR